MLAYLKKNLEYEADFLLRQAVLKRDSASVLKDSAGRASAESLALVESARRDINAAGQMLLIAGLITDE